MTGVQTCALPIWVAQRQAQRAALEAEAEDKRDIRLVIQLILGFRLKRCTLGLTLGDPVYSTTLLPGEKVKLFTTDRRTARSPSRRSRIVTPA